MTCAMARWRGISVGGTGRHDLAGHGWVRWRDRSRARAGAAVGGAGAEGGGVGAVRAGGALSAGGGALPRTADGERRSGARAGRTGVCAYGEAPARATRRGPFAAVAAALGDGGGAGCAAASEPATASAAGRTTGAGGAAAWASCPEWRGAVAGRVWCTGPGEHGAAADAADAAIRVAVSGGAGG